jgi:hypothetical protein
LCLNRLRRPVERRAVVGVAVAEHGRAGKPAGSTCWRNWRAPIWYRSMPPDRSDAAIAGIANSGVTYLGMLVGSRVPPGTGARAPAARVAAGRSVPSPTSPPAWMTCLRVGIAPPSWSGSGMWRRAASIFRHKSTPAISMGQGTGTP